MGGGVAGWLTPGWMTYEKSLAPHISTPGKRPHLTFRVRKDNAEGGREPKASVDGRLQAPVQVLEREVGEMRNITREDHQNQPHKDLPVSHERLRHMC